MALINNEDHAMHNKAKLRLIPAPVYQVHLGDEQYLNAVALNMASNARESYRHGESAFAQIELVMPGNQPDHEIAAKLRMALQAYITERFTVNVSTNDFGDMTVAVLIIHL